MEASGLKNEDVRENELEIFCESLVGNIVTKYEFTIDYFDASVGILNSKENPTSLSFCVALLREILCNLKPNHELWDKIKYAAFLLNLATRNIEFNTLYEIFHQVETEVKAHHWSWREAQVKSYLAQRIAEKIIVKDDVCSLPDIDDSKGDIDYDDLPDNDDINDHVMTNGNNNNDFDLDDDLGVHKDDLLVSGDEEGDADYVVDAEEERLAEAEGFDDNYEEDLSDEKVDVKKIVKEEKPKKLMKRPYRKRTEEEKRQPKVKRKRGRPRKEMYSESNPYVPSTDDVPETEDDKAKMPCHQCKYKARTQIELERHAFERHEANRLCTQCGHLSDTYKDYIKHNESHLFNCEVCQKKILGSRNLRAHMKLHETKKEDLSELTRIPCDICGQLLLEVSIKSHMQHVHSSEVHKCDMCDFTANTKSKITVHRNRHFLKLQKCPECGKTVKCLKRHFQRNCAGSRERHYCHLCEKSFTFKQGLTRHIKHIHQKITDFHCQLCDYKTYSKFNLKLHISKMHTKEDMEKICPYCSQKTNSLEYHMKIYHYEITLKNQGNFAGGAAVLPPTVDSGNINAAVVTNHEPLISAPNVLKFSEQPSI